MFSIVLAKTISFLKAFVVATKLAAAAEGCSDGKKLSLSQLQKRKGVDDSSSLR